jgi:hypothetical protein
MFRNILSKGKNIKLGRWDTNKKNDAIIRQIDLANCDSCGTCGIPDYSNKQNKQNKKINIKIKLPLTSVRQFSSFHDLNTKCCCFGDTREIRDCVCMTDFYSEKKEIQYVNKK